MRTFFYALTSTLFAGGALLAAPAAGQTIPSPYRYLEERQELGVLVGLMSIDNGRFNYGPKEGTLYGARYGIELSGPLSFEGVVQYLDGTRWVVDPGRPEGDRRIGEAPADVTTIEARLKFTATGRRSWHHISPFLDFGAGIAMDSSELTELDMSLLPDDRFDFGTSFFGTLSGGVRWFATSRFTLRGDATMSLWEIDTPPGYADPDRDFVGVSGGEWLIGGAVTLALLYRW